jgi:hypothetical protein
LYSYFLFSVFDFRFSIFGFQFSIFDSDFRLICNTGAKEPGTARDAAKAPRTDGERAKGVGGSTTKAPAGDG